MVKGDEWWVVLRHGHTAARGCGSHCRAAVGVGVVGDG